MSRGRLGGPDRPRMAGLVAGLSAFSLLGGCSNDSTSRAADGALPTTTISAFDAALPLANDLGAGYEEVPVNSAMTASCSFVVDEPARRAARSFVSNAAQERIDLQLLRYKDEQTASGAFAEAQAASSCRPSQFGEAGGQPRAVEIEGAQTAFDIGFTNQVDSVGVTVAVVGDTVVVARSALHQGVSKGEPLGANEAAARAITRLR